MFVGVVALPRIGVDPRPGFLRHQGMTGAGMLQVVFVHVGVHGNPARVEILVVLRARQRRQEVELKHVER